MEMTKFFMHGIEWSISDEDRVDRFGSTVDDNGLPYTARDFGLPFNATLDVDTESDAWKTAEKDGNEASCLIDMLSEEYGFLVDSVESWSRVSHEIMMNGRMSVYNDKEGKGMDEEKDDIDEEKDDRFLVNLIKSVGSCRESMGKLRKVLDGLVEFADMRDQEDAGDWVVVVNTAELVSRSLKGLEDNLEEAVDRGNTGYL